MNKREKKRYQEDATLFKALAHPTRLFVIHEVNDKKLSIRELAKKVGVDMSTMSNHLDVLKKSGIIEGKKGAEFCLLPTGDALRAGIHELCAQCQNKVVKIF